MGDRQSLTDIRVSSSGVDIFLGDEGDHVLKLLRLDDESMHVTVPKGFELVPDERKIANKHGQEMYYIRRK